MPADSLRGAYDAFISHNHADKDWARHLAERVAGVDYEGRQLRPWLDEQFLDPGELSRESELTSALDRSRTLLLVLTPASVASRWVNFELDYFLRSRPLEDVVPLVKARCDMPSVLANAKPLDFADGAGFDPTFRELVGRLCPPAGPRVADVEATVDDAWSAASSVDPGGFDATTSPERDALLAALLAFDIGDPRTEGPALTAFWRAAQRLLGDHEQAHPAAYNMKMLLGECLAVAMHRHARYRQVAQRYLDYDGADNAEPVLSFVVARASSKLAEIDPTLLDLGVLLRIATELDAGASFDNQMAAVGMLLGRIAAKLRGTDLGDLLIHTLSEGGPAARIAAIGGICMGEELAPPVFYLSELARMHAAGGTPRSGALEPPSRKLQGLLFAIDLDQPLVVEDQLRIGKDDLRRAFEIDDLPYGYSWLELRTAAAADGPHRAPFMGTVVKATTANMEELALRLDPSHVVCLTEPRIVEAIFERAGSLLIPLGDDTAQRRRLQSRGVPFAMLDAKRMAVLSDGDQVEVESDRMRVVSQR